ncbi:MAG: YbdD/YjiX family protein [Methylotetracoccus sp.]
MGLFETLATRLPLSTWLRRLRDWLSGDDAYRRYLEHWRRSHSDRESAPLSRDDFFRQRIIRRWRGVNRCC